MDVNLSWLIIPTFCFLFALITVSPQLYAWWKAPEEWVPVNTPPNGIGDDYHYFSVLNNIHRRLLNRVYGASFTTTPLSVVMKFQLVGFLFNLLPYHLGFLVKDRRTGVLFVRIWNRFFLGLSVVFFASLTYRHLGVVPTVPMLLLSYLLFFILYPGPFGLYVTNSIAFQLNNKRHIYDKAHENSFTRAMFSETSAPLLIASIAVSLLSFNNAMPVITSAIGQIFTLVLFFLYFPAAIYFAFLQVVFLVFHNFMLGAALTGFLAIGLTMTYSWLMIQSEIGKELFVPHIVGKTRLISRVNLNTVLSFIMPVFVLFLLFTAFPSLVFIILYAGSGIFLLSVFFPKSHLYRLWVNAAMIPFQLMSVIACIALIVPLFPGSITWLFICALIALSAYFYYLQSFFLYKVGATICHYDKGLSGIKKSWSNSFRGAKSRTIATNSTELGYNVDLYSGDVTYLRNMSCQPYGYRKHLRSIVANFKLLEYTYVECEKLMTSKVDPRDWLGADKRPFPRQSSMAKKCYEHTLQYMATNRDYNQGLLKDEMYDANGWTDKYRQLLKTIWKEVDVSEYGQAEIYRFETPY